MTLDEQVSGTEKRKGGYPKKPRVKRQLARVVMLVTPAEKLALERQAKAMDIPFSELARRALFAYHPAEDEVDVHAISRRLEQLEELVKSEFSICRHEFEALQAGVRQALPNAV